MATFKAVNRSGGDCHFILEPFERDDRIILGRLFTIGPFGVLPISEPFYELPILEAVTRAAAHVGTNGVVGVYDPSNLWRSDWGDLT